MPDAARERILILATTGRDGELTERVLEQHGFDCFECSDVECLADEIARDAGAVVLGQEALDEDFREALGRALAAEPLWSDLPFVILTRGGRPALDLLGSLELEINATLLERPIHVMNLVSAVRAALRARRRQYEVRDLLERLAQEDRRKDEFLAMLGHELRNPLSAIHTAVDLMGRSEVPAERVERCREIAAEQVGHLARVVDDLLDLTRITAGTIELRTEPVDLVALVGRVAETLELTSGGGEIAVEAPDRPVAVTADPVRLEQVISNLVQAAIDYSGADRRVRLAVGADGDQAILRVRDDRPASASGATAPADGSGRRHGGSDDTAGASDVAGFGLGLDLARRLVERHGGTVEAASEGRGRGAEFTVRLPLRPASADDGERPAEPADQGPSRFDDERAAAGTDGVAPRVLLVEDNEGGREALGELLRVWGYDVDEVETGNEALEHAFADPPRVALVDIDLPDLSGYEIARRLCKHFNGDRPYLVAVTGFGQPEDRRRALEAGFDLHLVKPVAATELNEVLSRATGGR